MVAGQSSTGLLPLTLRLAGGYDMRALAPKDDASVRERRNKDPLGGWDRPQIYESIRGNAPRAITEPGGDTRLDMVIVKARQGL